MLINKITERPHFRNFMAHIKADFGREPQSNLELLLHLWVFKTPFHPPKSCKGSGDRWKTVLLDLRWFDFMEVGFG